MERAKTFIKSTIANKSKSETEKIAKNLDAIIDNHIRDIKEEIKGLKLKKLENEISQISHNLTIDAQPLGSIVSDQLINNTDFKSLD